MSAGASSGVGSGTDTPAGARRRRTGDADRRVRQLLEEALRATGCPPRGVSVVGVGGYGRGELSAASDLDLMLVHDGSCPDLEGVAAGLWYPLWDAHVAIDHSVRTVAEAREAAAADQRTALSLLDARHVAGDGSLSIALRSTLLADWRRDAWRRLPQLRADCRDRAARFGALGALLEPDLKLARGGLRDGVVLRALAATWLVDVPHAEVAASRAVLLDARDALHAAAGVRPTDRLVAELRADVAARLGLAGSDALLRRVYGAARRLAHLLDLAWRRADQAMSRRTTAGRGRPRLPGRPGPPLTPLARGVAAVDGEVVLSRDADPDTDPALPLRAAVAATRGGLALSPYSCDRLARAPAPAEPWPVAMRALFAALLGAGPALLPVWETLDAAGLVDRLLPEWDRVRCAPQRAPVHAYTVDHHLLQTCVAAAALASRVGRPDLLVTAALLHDIGKGGTGDHAELGARLTARIAARCGYPPADVQTLVRLVRRHLLLSRAAGRSDPDDPATVDRLATAVGDLRTLQLLAALTEADTRATGSGGWSEWRAQLVATLVDRIRSRLRAAD